MFEQYILTAFLEMAKIHSTKHAFCINGEFHSYTQFIQSISKIRTSLQNLQTDSKNIGLVANDDIETYASIFAIWLEGFAYVPLHPSQPSERILEIIQQSEIELVLDSSAIPQLENTKIVETDKLEFDVLNLVTKPTHEGALAYILFTSGSTGKPKGVPISRKNVGAFMKSFWETGIIINENDRCLQCFDLTFDISVQAFLVPLTKGACTYTIPHNKIKYSYVYGLLEDHQLTFSAMPPSMIRYLRPYFGEINIPSMRYNIVTAEASPVDLILEWSKCIPNAEIFNFYGPTEATIYCTYYKFVRKGMNKQFNGMLSIGNAMPGLNAIIIDQKLNLLGKNEKGELCISGDQVTSGYWQNTEKNLEAFFEINFDGKVTRFYKTGDCCYFDEDDTIILVGRLDHQVKIQGYRIELGDIEFHAREFLSGNNAVAISFENKLGNNEIALFIEGHQMDEKRIEDFLRRKIPQYMIPTKFLFKEVFPLNTNGKIDRNILKNEIII